MRSRKDYDKWLAEQFDSAFKEHYHKVRHVAFNFLKNHEQAEDVAQDVFVTLWKKRHELDFTKSVFPWLITITRNSCLNIVKSHKVQQKYQDRSYNIALELRRDLAKSSTDFILRSNEVDKLLKEAIDKMTPQVKETFLLCRFRDKKYKEVAEIQKVSIKTIEYRIMSALKIIRKEFKDFLGFLLL